MSVYLFLICTSLRASGVCMHWCTIVWYDCDVKRRSGCPYGAKQEANRPNKKNVYNAIHPDTQTHKHTQTNFGRFIIKLNF